MEKEKLAKDLLLACSVRRHGLENWEKVTVEFSSAMLQRKFFIPDLSPAKCKSMYEDLKRRFKSLYPTNFNKDEEDDDDETAFVQLMADKLNKAYIVVLKEEVKRADAIIQEKFIILCKLEAEERIELSEKKGEKSNKKKLENTNINDYFIRILGVLRSHKHCCLFESRLRTQEEREYLDQIRQHMDLQIIQNKLEQDVYSNMEDAFWRDLLLMFSNAIVYYPDETLQHSTALELKAIVARERAKRVFHRREVVCGLAAKDNQKIQEKFQRKKYSPRKKPQEGEESSSSVRRSERVNSEAWELKNDPDYACYDPKAPERRRRNKKK